MDSDEDLDTHLCLKCRKTIVGLDNYVYHKRSECPSLVTKKDCVVDTKSKDAAGGNLLVEPLSEASVIPSRDNQQQLQPDDFFLSLELQHINAKHVVTTSEADGDDRQGDAEKATEDDVASTVSSIHFESTLDDINEYYVEETSVVDCDVNEDSYGCGEENKDGEETSHTCPPSGHTGGKWKPGTVRDNCSQWIEHTSPSSDCEHEFNGQHQVKVESLSVSTEIDFSHDDNTCNPPSYHCAPCGMSMPSRDLLVDHFLTPSHWSKARNNAQHNALILKYSNELVSKAPFSCAVCHFYFNDLKYMLEHWSGNWKGHNNRKAVFLCSLCNTYLPNVKSVTGHLKAAFHVGKTSCQTPLVISAVKRTGPFACNSCPYKARSYSAFDGHIRYQCKRRKTNRAEEEMVAESESNHVCNHCESTYSSPSLLKDHIEKSHGDNALRCQLCSLTFSRRSHLLKHKTVHGNQKSIVATANTEGKFSCKTCSFKSDVEAKTLYHEALHMDPILKPIQDNDNTEKKQRKKTARLYRCSVCEMLFRKPQLLQHLLSHTGEKPFQCELCNAAFSRRCTLYSHQKALHGGKNLTCDKCDFKTHKRSKLKLHLSIHEANRPRPFMCDTCGARFTHSDSLKYHMKIHTGGKTHICTFEGCGRAHRFASDLAIHYRTHTDERPFLCTQCGYSAKTRHQLTKHERRHTGERPFKCTRCSYAAALSAQLWRHMRIHTGSRPYSCPHCDYTCNTSENLRKHVLKSKKHKGLNVYVCPFCSFGCDRVKEFQDHVLENHKGSIDANETLSTTYFSLLSGVYDRNSSKTEASAPAVSDTKEHQPKKTGNSVLGDVSETLHDVSETLRDDEVIVEHVVLEDLVLELVVPNGSVHTTREMESKICDTLSLECIRNVEKCTSVVEEKEDTDTCNAVSLSVKDASEGDTQSLTLSKVEDNINGDTIFIYLPIKC